MRQLYIYITFKTDGIQVNQDTIGVAKYIERFNKFENKKIKQKYIFSV